MSSVYVCTHIQKLDENKRTQRKKSVRNYKTSCEESISIIQRNKEHTPVTYTQVGRDHFITEQSDTSPLRNLLAGTRATWRWRCFFCPTEHTDVEEELRCYSAGLAWALHTAGSRDSDEWNHRPSRRQTTKNHEPASHTLWFA